jgi:eukaryotic-like serine/threonine-protein kinase
VFTGDEAMNDERKCLRCGKLLADDLLAEMTVCPACLLAAAVAPADSLDATVDPERTVELPKGARDEPLPVISARYRVIQEVGVGGMGVVYQAEQRSPVQRIVAIKLIKLGMDTKQVIARFESERQALAMLNHPNVAAVYDAGATETGRPYFVMEWVPGEPITDFCDRHNYTTKQRLELFIQACDAIQHAHQKAIIHRDIKPSNLLVTLDGDKPLVKVIDFGVAKATAHRLTQQTMFTEQGQLIGTPEYMSPEQAEMNALDIDTRTDIYSLGVVLYELLTGAVPFDSRTFREAAYAQIQRIIREVDPPRMSTRLSSMGDSAIAVAKHRQMELAALAKQLRGELEWIPLKALRKDRTQRYSTANELAEDIKNYLENKPLVAGPESATYRMRKFLRRNKGPVAAAAVVALALATGFTLATVGFVQASRQRLIAQNNEAKARTEAGRADREAEKARTEAAKQAAINKFLNEMLASANPRSIRATQGVVKNVTVLEVLDRATRKLDAGALKDRPEIEAELRMTIGATFRGLGLEAAAEPHFKRALELKRQQHGAQDPEVAPALVMLARTFQQQGRATEAEPLIREALAIQEKTLAPEDDRLVFTLQVLGQLLIDQKKLSDAEPLLRRSVEIRLKSAGKEAAGTAAGPLSALGSLLSAQGNYREAELLYRRALSIGLATFGEDHANIISAMATLADVLAVQGEFEEAEALYRKGIALTLRHFDDRHTFHAWLVGNLGSMLASQGKVDEVTQLLKTQHLNGDPRQSAMAITLIAASLQVAGKLAEAEELHREALAHRRKALPESSSEVGWTLARLTSTLLAASKNVELEHLWRETIELRRKELAPEDLRLRIPIAILALLPKQSGKSGGADALPAELRPRAGRELRRPITPATTQSSNKLQVELLANLNTEAITLRRSGRLEVAAGLQKMVVDAAEIVLPPEDNNLFRFRLNYAALLISLRQFDKAESIYREELASFRKLVGSAHRSVEEALAGLARTLEGQGRLPEAESVWREELDIERKLSGNHHIFVANSLNELARVLQAQGQLLEAEAARREATEIEHESAHFTVPTATTAPATVPAARM